MKDRRNKSAGPNADGSSISRRWGNVGNGSGNGGKQKFDKRTQNDSSGPHDFVSDRDPLKGSDGKGKGKGANRKAERFDIDSSANAEIKQRPTLQAVALLRDLGFADDIIDDVKRRAAAAVSANAAPKQPWQEVQSLRDKLRNMEKTLTKCDEAIEFHQQELMKAKDNQYDLTVQRDELQSQLSRLTNAKDNGCDGNQSSSGLKVVDIVNWIEDFHIMMGRGAEHVSAQDLNALMAKVPNTSPLDEDATSDFHMDERGAGESGVEEGQIRPDGLGSRLSGHHGNDSGKGGSQWQRSNASDNTGSSVCRSGRGRSRTPPPS